MISEMFNTSLAIIGMVHLPPLPGAPGWTGELTEIEIHATEDVNALIEGGAHGILFENFGDAPFTKGKVNPLTVSSMTRVILNCIKNVNIPFGINILRNDWEAALSISVATGAKFIRVNILSGVYVTDQGVIEGDGYACMGLRRKIERDMGRKVVILADAHTKHGKPLVEQSLEDAVKDLTERVGVEGVIITGLRTGEPTTLDDVEVAKKAAGGTSVLVGSGVNPNNIQEFSQYAQGFIVGSYLKKDGKLKNPVDPARVRALVECLS